MTQHDFKAAIADVNMGLDFVSNPMNIHMLRKETVDAIRLALRIAERLQNGEVSQGFPSMAQEGAVVMWDECKEGLVGHPQATAVFRNMAQQLIKECDQ
jgi:hypothetical protein